LRRLVLIVLPLIAAGCTSITYNCNVPDSCKAAPKPGLSLRLVMPEPSTRTAPTQP
jgi:hypothetical protein